VSISVLDICAYVGLVAVGAVAFNMVLGMLMALRYSPVRSWPHRRFNYFQLHNWSGYVALGAAILHPLILLFDKPTRFRMLDVVYPVHSPSQPLENTIGAVALYTVAIVVVTSYLRLRLGRRLWKSVHFTIYFAAVALFWHRLFTAPDLKNSPVQWLDGGIHRGLPSPNRGHNRCALAVLVEEGAPVELKDEAAVSKRLDV
jgi:predicted ferric reductase